MPRKSPFAITLTDEEARVLKRRAQTYTLPYFQVQRARMILLAAQGLRNDEIAARLNTRREVVSQWRKRFFHERLPGLDERPRPGRPRAFPPQVVVQVKALACELSARLGLPLSRMSIADVAHEVRRAGIVASISDKTVWRWLHEDAIRPWQHRGWIFPRDPDFRVKAGAHPGPLRRPLERHLPARRRVRHLDGQEDQHPGPPAYPRAAADRAPPSHARRT